jgi:hypothetical protein
LTPAMGGTLPLMPARDLSRRLAPGGVLAVIVSAVLLVAACGEDEAPRPDREEVRHVLVDFFQDAADGDVEAVCGALTGTGRAQAAGKGSITGRLPDPISEERCVEKKARTATSSVDLPVVIRRRLLRVQHVRIDGNAATARVCNAALCREQRLRKTEGGWRIESFQLPVND